MFQIWDATAKHYAIKTHLQHTNMHSCSRNFRKRIHSLFPNLIPSPRTQLGFSAPGEQDRVLHNACSPCRVAAVTCALMATVGLWGHRGGPAQADCCGNQVATATGISAQERERERERARWHVLIFAGAALEQPFLLTNGEFHLATRDEWQESARRIITRWWDEAFLVRCNLAKQSSAGRTWKGYQF